MRDRIHDAMTILREPSTPTGVVLTRPAPRTRAMAPRVLIVEDNDATRIGLSELLTRAGYTTQTARSFEQGIRAMRDDPPDLLIADVRLGPYNGLQLLVTGPKRVPTIIMTGFPDPVLEADAHHLGAEFILKPVSPQALLALVEQELAARPAQELSGPTRRWARKQVPGDLVARVEDVTARILDVSYGGLRFALPREADSGLPSSVNITLPSSDLSVQVDLVWSSRDSDGAWLYGAALSEANQAASRAWCGLVDTLA
jgi:two-component system response regulator (stage 0 sporulation protein F)